MRRSISAPTGRASLRGVTGGCLVALALAGCADDAPPRGPLSALTHDGAAAPWLPGPGTSLDLAGAWEAWLDPGAVGLAEGWAADLSARRRPPGAPGFAFELPVPGPLEATEGTLLQDGLFWLARDVSLPPSAVGTRAVLGFGQVNDLCHVFWDGEPLGAHESGYAPFAFELSPRQATPGLHRLVLMVLDSGSTETLGRRLRTIAHSKEDWYENFGGVLGPVAIELRTGWSVRELLLRPDPVANVLAVEARLAAPRRVQPGDTASVTLRAQARDGGRDVGTWSGAVTVGADGVAALRASLPLDASAPRWTPEAPGLLDLRLTVDGQHAATQACGLRRFELRDGDVLLEGRRRVLKGVLWQPHFTGLSGRMPPGPTLEEEARLIKAAGFDLVRAHVRPAPPAFLDACDRLGLMVLEEPAIGWVDDDPALPPRLLAEVEWMVRRDLHHPSLVLWGVLNELSGRAYRHADALVARVAELDPSRPVLRDSGGFLRGAFLAPGAAAEQPMTDSHQYPPWPLPPSRRDELATLGAGAPGPTFASEFGYGTLLDTERADAGFPARMVRSAEAGLFRSFARTAERALRDDSGWASLAPGGSWLAAAAAQQADALVDMADALRSNPALDLLCVTQWRAASAESSSGLVEPWGEERPSLAALREALAPLRPMLLPASASLVAGEALHAQLVVANDSGAHAAGAARVEWTWREPDGGRAGTLELGRLELPPGATAFELSLPAPAATPGVLELRAVLRLDDGADLHGATAVVPCVAPAGLSPALLAALGPLPQPLVWAPREEPGARDFLRRLGVLAETPARAVVALLPRPDRLAQELAFDERMALWAAVLRGGVAIALPDDPAVGMRGQMTGAARGLRTLTELPRPVAIAPAAGNFNGRFHVLREGGGARLLGRGDETLSPVAMVTGAAPAGSEARLITLGFLGNRIGAPWMVVPFGAGLVHVVGLPLLDPLRGAPDPRRDAWLAALVSEALSEAVLGAPERRAAWRAVTGRELPDAWTPRPPAETEAFRQGFALLDQLVALGDRATPHLTSADEPRLPASAEALLDRRLDALTLLLHGDDAGALDVLRRTVEPLWTEQQRTFMAGEARVLDVLQRLAEEGPGSWDRAWDGVDAWSRALVAWFDGRQDEALQWLGRAAELLHLDGAAPP